MDKKLSKFTKPEKVDFKQGWENEQAFDEWLAEKEGRKWLADAIGVEIDADTIKLQEKAGGFRADIFAYDIDGKTVIFENQRGQSNHDHLGKILTYAGALTTDTPGCNLIWIAEKILDEHRAALDWLNTRTESENNFFGLEINLLKAGEALMPDFNVVSRPNDWSRTEKKKASGALSSTKELYIEFWKMFIAFLEKQRPDSCILKHTKSVNRCRIGMKHNFLPYHVQSPFHLRIHISQESMYVGLTIQGSEHLDGHRLVDYIEEEYGSELEKNLSEFGGLNYKHVPGRTRNTGRIFPESKDCELSQQNEWPSHFKWLADRAEAMYEILLPIINDIDLNDFSMEDNEDLLEEPTSIDEANPPS